MAWNKKRKINDLASAPDKILSAALNYLAKREYCERELWQKLTARGGDPESVREALSALKEKGYLDDYRYATAFVRDRREFRPCGAAMIRKELSAKGVAAEIIETAIEEEYDEERQRETLRTLLLKAAANAPQNNAEEMLKYRNKIIRRMLSKGFPQSMVLDESNNLLTTAAR